MSRFRIVFRLLFAGNPWLSIRSPKTFRYGMTLRPMKASNSTPTSPFETFDHLFGSSFSDCFHPRIAPLSLDFHEPWGKISSEDSGTSSVTMDEDGFKIMMDVQHFKPEEITVKQVEDCVVVEGKHEETEDEHGFVSRHFVRRHTLPQGVDHQALNSTLSSDGVLIITAPKVEHVVEENARIIQIEQTGKLAVNNANKEKGSKT